MIKFRQFWLWPTGRHYFYDKVNLFSQGEDHLKMQIIIEVEEVKGDTSLKEIADHFIIGNILLKVRPIIHYHVEEQIGAIWNKKKFLVS